MRDLTTNDLLLTLQRQLNLKLKLNIYKYVEDLFVSELTGGIISGNMSINAESDVRRTASFQFVPTVSSKLKIEEEGYFWIDKKVVMLLGVENIRTSEITWFKLGTFLFNNASMTYDATNNMLNLSCSDFVSLLDGTKNGELGQKVIKIPAYTEDEQTGEVIKYNTIREALIYTIDQLGRIKNYEIDDIGEYLGMPQYNENYLEYREESAVPVQDGSFQPIWNTVPYDLEFKSGCTVLSIIKELVSLYPNYEFYFDEDNNFCCNMIPSCYDDDVVLEDEYMEKILISENTTIDMNQVRNIVEIWGKSIETDYFNDSGVTLSGSTYTYSNSAYKEKYYNGDKIAFRVPATNPANAKININNFGAIAIYDENTDEPLAANNLEANEVYAFKIKSKYVNHESVMRAYLMGRYQVHSMAALVSNPDGELDDMVTFEGKTFPRYSEEYFKTIYNCEYVYLDVVPDSPFTCQKQGTLLKVMSGKEFDNIESSAVGIANAKYQLWKAARLTDSISLVTKLCPFMDVNKKISYKPKQYDEKEEHQYIVKNISHDFSAGTTTWQLMRFYSLYKPGVVNQND